jgi:hypothetical protein
MTWDQRVSTVSRHGFTERQAAFLVTVMLHAGVCVRRQYCAFAGITHGQVVSDFFGSLVQRGYASAHRCGSPRWRVFHVHHKTECFMSTGAALGRVFSGRVVRSPRRCS